MNLHISVLSMDDAEALFEFEKVNKEFFEKFVPARPDSYFSYEKFIKIIEALLEEQKESKSLFFLIKNQSGEILGRINLVDIDWSCKTGDVGYRVGKKFIGKGVAVKALEMVKSEALLLGMRKLMAKTTVDNIPSQKVLERCFFQIDQVEKDQFIYYSVSL